MQDAPLFLEGVCKGYLWGGNRLREQYGKKSETPVVAESWELSTHPAGECRVRDGAYHGKTLRACIGGELPILVKLLDAREDLSIQVHPDDKMAWEKYHARGKTEMWYIVEAAPHASIYYGVKETIDRETLKRAVATKTVTDLLRRVEVHAGESYYIPAGTIHAIGAGILLAEIQESSDITYRLYDYERRDAMGQTRPLHIADGIAAAHLEPNEMNITTAIEHLAQGVFRLPLCPQGIFETARFDLKNGAYFSKSGRARHMLVLEGNGILANVHGEKWAFKKGDSVYLSATGEYTITGTATWLETQL